MSTRPGSKVFRMRVVVGPCVYTVYKVFRSRVVPCWVIGNSNRVLPAATSHLSGKAPEINLAKA